MDPLTALGLVGTIAQLIDFGAKVVSRSTELYHSTSGALEQNADVEAATADLAKLKSQLDSSTNVPDNDLRELCDACGKVAAELLGALDKVRVSDRGRKWQSLRKALKSMWTKDKIENLESRLATLRQELNLRINVGLRYVSSMLKAVLTRDDLVQFSNHRAQDRAS